MIRKRNKKIWVGTLGGVFLAATILGSTLLFATAEDGTSFKVRPEALWETVKFSDIGKADIPDWYNDLPAGAENTLLAQSGVNVENFGASAAIRYKNVIDVSDLSKEDIFIQLAITPETRGSEDFKQLYIHMIDADNPENYVEIEIHHSQWWKATTFYQVGTNSIANAGLRWGYYAEGESEPCGELMGFESLMGAFTGWESYDGTNFITERGATRAITLRYDNAEKAFYCDVPANNNMSVNTQMILDLDDPRQVGVGNEWAGFASDRIKVEISTSNYASSKASYIITEFNGVNYGAEYVEDTTPPALKTQADSDASLLTAVVGREYPLFAATADDCVDGAILNIKRYIVLPRSSERIPIEGNTYTPTVPGEHELIYSVSDSSGNKSEKKYPLSVVMVPEPLVLNLKTEIPERVKVGETIAIPEVAVSGGVGPKDVSVCSSRLADGNIKAENVKSFRPELSGTYAVEYKATDYLGSVQTVTYFIDAVRSASPICSFPVLPNMLLANKTVELPVLNSSDYSAGNVQGSKAVVNLYASFEKNKKGEKIDYLYTPKLSESETKKTLYITYETYCNGHQADALSRVYEIEVVKAEQLYDFFDKKNISATPNSSYIDFTTETDGATMRYVNPLPAKNFEVLFDIPIEENNFRKISLTFTDCLNPEQQLLVDIVRNDGNKRCFAYVNGEKFEMSGGFSGESNVPFHITFKTSEGKLIDHDNRTIATLSRYANGDEYTGFDSGRFYVDFTFGEVTGKSTIRLQRLSNQAMFADYDYDGNIIEVSDYIEPIIVTEYDIVTDADRHDRVFVSPARAYDAFDPYVECYVTVSRDGKKIISDVRAENGLEFFVDEYGTYLIVYNAEDSSGNTVTRRFRIVVRDKDAPALTVLGDVATEKSQGDILKIPDAVAQDLNGKATLRIFMISPTGAMTEISQIKEYQLQNEGRYTLLYYAYDEVYNVSMKEFFIEVH